MRFASYPFLGAANFAMAATPLAAVLIAYFTASLH
jgi:hypothetical protein